MPTDVCNVCNARGFWKQVVEVWAQYNFNDPISRNDILNQCIWYNTHIRIENKPFYLQGGQQTGLEIVNDLIVNNRFCMYTELLAKDIEIPRLTYYSIISAIPIGWKRAIKLQSTMYTNIDSKYTELYDVDKVCNIMYDKYIMDMS